MKQMEIIVVNVIVRNADAEKKLEEPISTLKEGFQFLVVDQYIVFNIFLK